jgi:hypothetical protein
MMRNRAWPLRSSESSTSAIVFVAALMALMCLRSAAAHHAFASVFDAGRQIEVTGTVTDVEWMNPHVWIHVDAKTDEGGVENWGFEMGSVNQLVRLGWSRDALKVGDTVTVLGVRARDDTLRAAIRTVTLANGEQLFGGQNEAR